MRIMIWTIAFLALGWSGYWVVANTALERGAGAWFDARRGEGWQADYKDLTVSGFPYRFDTTLTDVALADPGTGAVWQAPEFIVTALAYQPNHVIAIFPDEQTLRSPFDTLTVTSSDMRASARVGGTNVELRESTAQMADVALRSTQGWDVTLESGLLATRAQGDNVYDLYFEAKDLRPSDALRLGVDPQGRLPDTFETLRLDASLAFDAPWDRFAIEVARPQPTRIDLKDFNARWGQLELRAVGALDVDANGAPEGRITVKATNWRDIVSIGEATGLLPESAIPTITRGLEVLASLSGPANTIDVPLSFQRGFVSLGPIPLGPAPRLRLR
ncbi:MAG: DUF2125 domain-containing protein [Pseudomonadota bacterium]